MEGDPLARLEQELDAKLAEEAGSPYVCPECGSGAWHAGGSGTRQRLPDGRIRVTIPVRCVNQHVGVIEEVHKPKRIRTPKRGFY